ncbi:DegT/DnrJ/EryC1/StrS family aminotransferase [Bradyrhizobium jicamae]|nr:DegT/DnrJ/EryC1/StrS family aminotransferase [Bradyrhizobium jicamae]
MAIARRRGFAALEDAAQSVTAAYKARAGGDRRPRQLHETKNVISGEGGVLLVGDPALEYSPDKAGFLARLKNALGGMSAHSNYRAALVY